MTGAGARQEPRRALDGVLLLDKPGAMTSNAALRSAQRLYRAARAGHTGTLDPLATGLLPLCFGEATKFAHVLLDADKTYHARVRLGVTTTTGDVEGEVTASAPVAVTPQQIAEALTPFVGEIMQVPPMYSAIKRDGQPLYKLARAGAEVPRAPRPVVVRELTLLEVAVPEFEMKVVCGKGTYVRVLAEEIGRALGCGACLSGLRRTAAGGHTLAGAVTLDRLAAMLPPEREAVLLPPDALLAGLPRLDLDAEQARRIVRGQAVEPFKAAAVGLARIYSPDRQFLGLAEVTIGGRMVPRRLRAAPAATREPLELLLEKTRS